MALEQIKGILEGLLQDLNVSLTKWEAVKYLYLQVGLFNSSSIILDPTHLLTFSQFQSNKCTFEKTSMTILYVSVMV